MSKPTAPAGTEAAKQSAVLPPSAAPDAARPSVIATGPVMRRPSMLALYGGPPQLSGMYSARQGLSGTNVALSGAQGGDPRRQSIVLLDSRPISAFGAPQFPEEEQAVVAPWVLAENPMGFEQPLNLERKDEQAQEHSMHKKKVMAGMAVIICISAVAALLLLQGTDAPTTQGALMQTQTTEDTTTKSRPTNATKATTLTTVELPPSKPSIGLTCICEDSTKLSMAAYDDMCSRLYVRLSYDKYGLLIDVPDTIRDIIELHPKKVGVAASFRGVENEMTLFESLKKEDAWLAVGCGLLEVPFRKVFATHLIKNFLAIVSKKVPPEMVMISIEPDDYISRLAENIESSKLAGVSIIVVTPRKGDFSCPTEGLWKQKEMLDCAIMLNKNLTQPVSIATTAAVAELKFASGKRDVCKSVTKVTTEVTGCSGKFKQRKFMCGSKIYYAESDVTLSEMASYAKKNGLNCALLDTEMGQLSAKYIRRSMFNLNCNTTSKSKHNEVYDDDDGT
ncbi:uncharacterized protein LOC142771355 [Rhipicephalus microplus]|uniref:uncharacterized protein LOC142771355 n=1 Tax=Rhipicephalus microplus TaxID=6941 RepID=UPI003F6AA37F